MSDNGRLASKIRLLTQLSEQTNLDQSEVLSALLRVLEDDARTVNWRVLSARRMILATLDTHFPSVDTAGAMERWRRDHKAENDKQMRERDDNKIIPYRL